MGSLMSVEKKERCIVYSLDDGLGEMVNVVLWRDMEAETGNWDEDHFEPNAFIKAIGTPSLYMGDKQLNVMCMRQVLEPTEIYHHIEDAFYVDFCIERNPVSSYETET